MKPVMEGLPQGSSLAITAGIGRRAQHKRSLHPQGPHDAISYDVKVCAKRPRHRIKRALTAPCTSALDCSTCNVAGHPESLMAKASSCPPSHISCALSSCLEESGPLTPRILALPPAAAVAAASKSPPVSSRATPAAASSTDTGSAPQSQASASRAVDCSGATAASTLRHPAVSQLVFPVLPRISTPPAVHAAFNAAKNAEAMPSISPVKAAGSLMGLAVAAGVSPTSVSEVKSAAPNDMDQGSVSDSSGRRCKKVERATVSAASQRSRAPAGESRTGGYQGRFCGRLYLKDDEAKLATECQLLGPLLGCVAEAGARAGDPGRHTLAKIVRNVASGAVRKHCQRRERRIKELEDALLAQQEAAAKSEAALLTQNQAMRTQVEALAAVVRPGRHNLQAPAATMQLSMPQAALAAASAAAAEAQAVAGTVPITVGSLSSVAPPSPALQRALCSRPTVPPLTPSHNPLNSAAASALHASLALASNVAPAAAGGKLAMLPAAPAAKMSITGPTVVAANHVPHMPRSAHLPYAPQDAHSCRNEPKTQHGSSLVGSSLSFGKTGLSGTGPAESDKMARLSMDSVADSCGSGCDVACPGGTPTAMPTLPRAPPKQPHPPLRSHDYEAIRQAAITAAQQAFDGFKPSPQQHFSNRSHLLHFGDRLQAAHRSAFQPVPQRTPLCGVTRPVPIRPQPIAAIHQAS